MEWWDVRTARFRGIHLSFFSISYGFEITDCDLKSHAKSCHAAQRSAQRNRCVPEHRDYEGIRAAATRGDS